jgi:peroxiredoxin
MIELGQLEAKSQEFDKRKVQIVAVSVENLETTQAMQAELPHLKFVSDADRNLATAVDVMHAKSAPDGSDTSAPTTLLIDGDGTVRWLFRSGNVMTRLSPQQVLAAIDEKMPAP